MFKRITLVVLNFVALAVAAIFALEVKNIIETSLLVPGTGHPLYFKFALMTPLIVLIISAVSQWKKSWTWAIVALLIPILLVIWMWVS